MAETTDSTQATDTVGGAINGASTGSQIGGGWGALIGAVIQGCFSYYGTEQQKQAASGANSQNIQFAQEEKNARNEEAAKEWKWKSDEEGYGRTRTVADRLLTLINGTPELQQKLQSRLAAKPAAYDFRGLNPIA